MGKNKRTKLIYETDYIYFNNISFFYQANNYSIYDNLFIIIILNFNKINSNENIN